MFWLLLLTMVWSPLSNGEVHAQINSPRRFSERFVVQTLLKIQSAQATYQATAGNGNYGSLTDLRQANVLETVLNGGEKYGYLFALTAINNPGTASKFQLTATPRLYRKTGRTSFYLDESGVLRGADKSGAAAIVSDSMIDSCAAAGFSGEDCAMQDLRTLYAAEMTYQATVGGGDFGDFHHLYTAGLFRQDYFFISHGYAFGFNITFHVPGYASTLKLWARPLNYGADGFKSFFVDESGVLRGADKSGANANENDPPI